MHQSDGTAWMCFYSLTMFAIAIELAGGVRGQPIIESFEDMASKFFEHFVQIVDAMNVYGGTGLWDDEDGFYYDQIKCNKTGHSIKLKSKSPMAAAARHASARSFSLQHVHWLASCL